MAVESPVVERALYSSVDLLKMEVKTERQEEIPVGLIVQESALIDPQHAQDLAESMMGARKQIAPVTVRARLEDDHIVYDVIDGFHRTEGKRIIEQMTSEPQTMKAIVLYGCNDEELFDLRVLAASSVKSIKFARMAEWMKKSFLSTSWENQRIHELIEREEITLSQLFSLTQFDTSGKILGLEPDEVVELKVWASKKSKQWGRPLSTLMMEMRTVELSAPDLVQRVRTGGGGKGGRGVLTRARLEAIVTHLSGDWETQRIFADLAISRNILAKDLDFLVWSYVQAKEAFDEDTMKRILTEPDWLLNPKSVRSQETEQIAPQGQIFPPRHRRERFSHPKSKGIGVHSSSVEKPISLPNENLILEKHRIPETIRLLMNTILSGKGDELIILNLPQGELKLKQEAGILHVNDTVVQLTDREAELMKIFFLLEGMKVSDELLSIICTVDDSMSIKEALLSLRDKISILSEAGARELWVGRKRTYSWLAE